MTGSAARATTSSSKRCGLRAVSSGAYELQPVRLEDGELTPLEEAVAGVVARTSPASVSSIRVGASRGRSSAEALSIPEAEAPTPMRGGGESGEGDEGRRCAKRGKHQPSLSARKKAKSRAAAAEGDTAHHGATGRGRLATTSEIAKLKLLLRPIGRRRVHAL